MGDTKETAVESPVNSSRVMEEDVESNIIRKENLRGILSGKWNGVNIGDADDPIESKADTMANNALSRSVSSDYLDKDFLPDKSTQLHSYKRPLSQNEISYFEPRFQESLSDIRINSSQEYRSISKSLNARAFTQGSDIYLSDSSIGIETPNGRRTMAHEISHVLMNRRGGYKDNTLRREVELTNRVEFSTRYRNSEGEVRDDATEIELAVLVRVFYSLQRAGLIPETEHLGDDLNVCQRAAMGSIMNEMGLDGCSPPTTYEAALRVLVTDADDNGFFDINIEHLYRSRLTSLGQTACVDYSVIERAINAALDPTREWLDDQSDNADHSNDFFGKSTQFVDRYGGLTDEGQAVERLEDSHVITDVERYYWAAIRSLRSHVEENELQEAVTEVIAAATDLEDVGATEEAAQLFAYAFRGVVNNSAQTQRLLTALSDTESLQRLLTEEVDIRLTSDIRSGFDEHEGVTIREDPDDFDMTLSALITLITSRREFVQRVDDSTETDVSQTPTLTQMTSYMHEIVRTGSLQEVKSALHNTLDSQFIHSGGGVAYEGFPGASRAANMQGLFNSLSQDGAGRFVIDCDGFVAFARHFLDAGTGRFGFLFMDRRNRDVLRENIFIGSTHALMAVMEISSQSGFIVNNENVQGDFQFDREGTYGDLFRSIGTGLRSMGYTSQYTYVFIAPDQSIYDAGDDPNRWEWPFWSPSQETPQVEQQETDSE